MSNFKANAADKQILQHIDQLKAGQEVEAPAIAEALGLQLSTAESRLRELARDSRINLRRGYRRHPYYSRKPTDAASAWWQFCFINAARYGNRSLGHE